MTVISSLVKEARAFAIGAHCAIGQVRKYSGEPYWYHPAAVADMVHAATWDYEATAAALLHDVLEDTKVSLEAIWNTFGEKVATLVFEVTDVSRPADGNRTVRKALDRAHLAKASPFGQTIKVADLIDNTRSIVAHDPGFARVYMAEKAALLEVLTQANVGLLAEARALVTEYQESRLQEALR